MPLKAGARLGPYQIDAPLGAGGMGEVYRARDTRLDRVVAIKLILGHVAADPQFRERFDREAKAISKLDHPNICTLYDVGQDGDTSYLVMQHLEGETLADRLARAARPKSDPTQPPSDGAKPVATGELSPASASGSRGPLPIDAALRYATEIACALDAAHRHGIVHRDLKPGNVMITKTGTKLLDFGLAKLAEQGGTSVADAATRQAPLTGQGSFLGTLHYMSPEQLEARPVDARSDVFSFGIVLYEMLTGRRAFDAASQAGVITAIIGGETPALGEIADSRAPLPPAAQRALERLLARCLAKDPDHRWHCAADLAAELQWINEERQRSPGQDEATVPPTPISRTRERWWMAATGVSLLAAAGVALWLWPRPAPPPAPPEPISFSITAPPNTQFSVLSGFMGLSPDGRRIAFTTGDAGTDVRLWIRSLGSPTAQPVSGADGASQPVWSPDGHYLLFNQGGGPSVPLKKIDVSGGPASTIALRTNGRAAWSRSGVILFTGNDRRLFQVPDSGGEPKPVTELDRSRSEVAHSWPVFLPDGRRFIYSATSTEEKNRALFIASLDSPTERTLLVDGVASNVEYADGHLFYQKDGTLMAQQFDEPRGRLVGEPVPVMEDVFFNPQNGRAAFAVSTTGTLVVRSGRNSFQTTLTWLDERGKTVGTVGGIARHTLGARLSPDRTHVVMPLSDGQRSQLWVSDTERGVPAQITFDSNGASNPLWSPDSARVAFRSARNGKVGLYQRAVAGASSDELLFESPDDKIPTGFSRDGRLLFFQQNAGAGKGWDLWALPLTGDRKPYPILETPFNEQAAVLSPDGHWLAYYSDKINSIQVYVQSFPTATQELRISTTTGFWPAWGADSSHLYYMTSDFHLMEVSLTVTAGVLHAGVPRDLFVQQPGGGIHFFSLDPVGPRFLIPISDDTSPAMPLAVTTSWTKTLTNR